MKSLRHLKLGFAILTSVASIVGVTADDAMGARAKITFTVTSTLDSKTVLPHRIHWIAHPTLAAVSEVDFLIDGKVRWVEHNSPYVFGSDGDWLVTSFLTPGVHRFTVRARTMDGRAVSDVHAARVLKPGALPANIRGSWQRDIGAAQAGADLAGTWHLHISPSGWGIVDPKGGPGLIDVAYLTPDLLESHGPVWTRPMGPPGSPTDGNGWCDAPFPPVRYRFTATDATLTLQLVGDDHCGGEHFIWAGTWTRVA